MSSQKPIMSLSSSSFDESDNADTTQETIANENETQSPSSPVASVPNEDEVAVEDDVIDADDSDDSDDEETMYRKITNTIKETTSQLLIEKHHDLTFHNEEEIRHLTTIVRNNDGDIVDAFHKTTPIMTKYEKTRVLGQRCRQLENGAIPLVDLSQYEDEVLEDLFIAKLEMEQRVLPFIVRRPLPNGSSEYWKISDLEVV